MPTHSAFSRTISQLAPNTSDPNNPNSQSSWFSYIRNTCSRDRCRTVKPPTKTEFMRVWRNLNNDFVFSCCGGNNLEENKSSLQHNRFPMYPISGSLSASEERDEIKAVTWVRMILAFNMYAEVRKELGLLPYNKVDFIGSAGTNNLLRNRWKPRFHNRCAMYISDANINHMRALVRLDLNREDTTTPTFYDFWQIIFEIYDMQNYNWRFSQAIRNANPRISRNTSHNVSRVDNPTHSIAQEYLNRTDEEDEIDIILDNQHIANMLMNTENQLPDELKKIVYETCTALQISCPVDQ